jgi:cephalosporin-C deacetylase-like acetyl esterase
MILEKPRQFAPEAVHDKLMEEYVPRLHFNPGCDLKAWRTELKETLINLLGSQPELVDPAIEIEYEHIGPEFIDRRFLFRTEKNSDVPAHLLLPRNGETPFPVVICLQGHSSGMHLSLGRTKYDRDAAAIAGGRDFGLQAVRNGYAALVIEQRAFGERKDSRPELYRDRDWFKSYCHHAGMSALLVGRTLIGERVWDISRAVDILETIGDVDAGRIAILGHSGGGTAAWYALCLDSRIGHALLSCSICNFRDSIGSIDHCCCNYVPGILTFMDMSDMAALIAPRPLIISNGKTDRIFPIRSVEKTAEEIGRIYDAFGAGEQFKILIGEGGHNFYSELNWPVFNKMFKLPGDK